MFQQENAKFLHLVLLLLVLAVVVAGVVLITQGQRKIPVQYAQRAVGRKIMSGGTSFMPLRVNYAGVMPVIFAQAILMFPGMIFEKLAAILPAGFGKQVSIYIASHLGRQGFTYLFLYGLMILFSRTSGWPPSSTSCRWPMTSRSMEATFPGCVPEPPPATSCTTR